MNTDLAPRFSHDVTPLVWAICTVARSGSSWLSDLIASTRQLGYPREYLLDWKQQCVASGLSPTTTFEEYLSLLIPARSTPNGVFAVKGSVDEMAPFFELYSQAPCVWLRRANRIEQAISWYRAHDGRLWTREAGRKTHVAPLPYSTERIAYFLHEIERREAAWEQFFRDRPAPPLVLVYEQVVEHPTEAVHAIADYLGVDRGGLRLGPSTYRVVRDHITREWVDRAVREFESFAQCESPSLDSPFPAVSFLT